MRNRAKCKKCNEIVESFTRHDYVECKCGEIAVDGGTDYLRAISKNWENFLRIDDEENEIPITWQDNPTTKEETNKAVNKWVQEVSEQYLTKHQQLLDELDQMLANIEKLPPHAMQLPITHYDFASLLILLSAILRSDD